MDIDIVRADPAGNITIFVLSPVEGREARAALSRTLLADPALGAEQAGFVLPPSATNPRWRLEMMGGEFCGNAARSFGLFAARSAALAGKHQIPIEISGMRGPLLTRIDTEASAAWVEMPPPIAEEIVEIKGRRFPLYVFEGISHVIAEDIECDEAIVHLLAQERDCDALGVMFYDSRKRFMRPVVWVRGTGTTVFESSCGSGTAAFGAWEMRNMQNGRGKIAVAQGGGVIEAELEKKDGHTLSLSIGGKVGLGEAFRYALPVV